MRGKDERLAKRKQRPLVRLADFADDLNRLGQIRPVIGAEVAASRDDHGQAGPARGGEQEAEALVVAQRADEQEEAWRQPPAPRFEHVGWRGWRRVQPDGDDLELVPVARQHRARPRIVGRGRDDGVHPVEEALHERPVEREQPRLAHDVRMIGDEAGSGRAAEKVEEVHHRPGKMIVNQVGVPRQRAKHRQRSEGQRR